MTRQELTVIVLANPADPLPRGVLADHLDEIGEADEAAALSAAVVDVLSRADSAALGQSLRKTLSR